MARTARDVTEAELSILRVLWDQADLSVRQIAEMLSTPKNPTQPATVQKLLERLEQKKLVRRNSKGEVNTFRATQDRSELIDRRLRGIAEELCEGSLTPLLSHLVKIEKMSPSDRQALLQMIEDLDQKPSDNTK